MKTRENLPQDRIKRLEEIGFQWQVLRTAYNKTFEKRCRELTAFKEGFGHCNVPVKNADNTSLGQWCDNIRTAYKAIQKGMKKRENLPQDRIK